MILDSARTAIRSGIEENVELQHVQLVEAGDPEELIATALLSLGTADGQSSKDQEVHSSAGSSLTTDQQELTDFALARFALAGIDLPYVLIEFSASDAECSGYGGVYLPDVNTVRICRPSKTTMVHELAHAWLETTMTVDDQQAFVKLRGLDRWHGGPDWDQRGAEQAAEIVAWAVMDSDITIRWVETNVDGTTRDTRKLFKIPNSTVDRLAVAYEQHTGHRPSSSGSQSQASTDVVIDTANPEAPRR